MLYAILSFLKKITMKILKTTLLLAIFFMPFNVLKADYFRCNQSGNWNNPNIWTRLYGTDPSTLPGLDDYVSITGKTVTLNSDVFCRDLILTESTLDAANYNIKVAERLNLYTNFNRQPSNIINVKYLEARSCNTLYGSISSANPGGKIEILAAPDGLIAYADLFQTYGFSAPYPPSLSIRNCTIEIGGAKGASLFLGENSILRNSSYAAIREIFTDNEAPVGYGSFGRIEILNNLVLNNYSVSNVTYNWKCPVVINSTITVPDGTILGLSTTPEYTITGTGKIILQQGGLLNSSVGLAPLELKGPSLENYTVLNSLPIIFNGTTPQTLSGPGTINNVTVDNPNGLTIGNNDTFSINTLTLINGGLILNNKDLTVNTLIGDSPTRYVQTNGTGHFIRPLIPSGAFNTFPIGTATSYSPVTLRQFNTSSVSYKYGANVRNGINPARPLIGVAGTDFVNKEWGIIRESIVPATAVTVVQLRWQSADENAGADCNNYRMLHHNGTTWEALPEISTTRDCINKFIRLSNVTSFSPFAVGLANAVLSTDLISIKATPQYQAVLVNWQTANEQDMLDFGVERSVDGLKFEQIGSVKATNAPNIYSYKDATAQDNVLYYYRLAMRENNGKTEYSKVVTATLSGKNKTVSVFPNPAKDVLNISGIEPTDEWQIVDIIGKTRATYKGSQTLDLSGFSNGIYFIKIGNENRSRFVVSK
jgi:Secretion system C-terminal sorting domain